MLSYLIREISLPTLMNMEYHEIKEGRRYMPAKSLFKEKEALSTTLSSFQASEIPRLSVGRGIKFCLSRWYPSVNLHKEFATR
jgi:hypothetical protein